MLAAVALEALDRQFRTGDDVRLAPLGNADHPDGPTTVLAGRFGDDVMAAVRTAVAEMGGTVVMDVDEGSNGNA